MCQLAVYVTQYTIKYSTIKQSSTKSKNIVKHKNCVYKVDAEPVSNINTNGKENKKRTYWSIESLRDLRSSELKECEYCPYLHQVEKKTCAILGLFMLPILLLANRM